MKVSRPVRDIFNWIDLTSNSAFSTLGETVLRCPEYCQGIAFVAEITPYFTTFSLAVTCLFAPGGSNSRTSSGANTPVRKISAQEFERGGQVLKPMVSTVDGTPTFLGSLSSPSSSDNLLYFKVRSHTLLLRPFRLRVKRRIFWFGQEWGIKRNW